MKNKHEIPNFETNSTVIRDVIEITITRITIAKRVHLLYQYLGQSEVENCCNLHQEIKKLCLAAILDLKSFPTSDSSKRTF